MTVIDIDFESDYLAIMRASLRWWGYDVDETDSFEDVASDYYNVCRRNVPARPRRISYAAELTIPDAHATAYAQLLKKSKPVQTYELT